MILTKKKLLALRSAIMAAPTLPAPVDRHKPITDTLPEIQRLVYRLCDVEGLSTKEAAGCTAMRHAQVRKALERARTMLRARLA